MPTFSIPSTNVSLSAIWRDVYYLGGTGTYVNLSLSASLKYLSDNSDITYTPPPYSLSAVKGKSYTTF